MLHRAYDLRRSLRSFRCSPRPRWATPTAISDHRRLGHDRGRYRRPHHDGLVLYPGDGGLAERRSPLSAERTATERERRRSEALTLPRCRHRRALLRSEHRQPRPRPRDDARAKTKASPDPADRVRPPVASSEAGRALRPSVAATAESRALVSFTRGHAYEAGAVSVAHLHSGIAGLSAEIARDALLANLEPRRERVRPPA